MRYNSSRPKDGSEHLVADEIDKRLPPNGSPLHGEQVAIGALIMGYLYSSKYDPKSFNEIRNTVEALGLPVLPEEIGVDKPTIIQSLTAVKTRPDKYTYFDSYKIDEEKADDVYEKVFGTKKGEIDEFTFEVSQYVQNSVEAMFDHIYDEVLPNLDVDKTRELLTLLLETKKRGGRVIINAAGRVGEVAVFFQQKLRALGFNVDDFKEITPEFLISKDDLVLTLSGSGKTRSVIDNLENVDRLHRIRKLDRRIFSITASPGVDTWGIGKDYHTVMQIKGRTKEDAGKKFASAGEEYLPLSSTFEYSIMLYLESIVEALTRNPGKIDNNTLGKLMNEVIGGTPNSIKETMRKRLMENEIATANFVNLLLSAIEKSEETGYVQKKKGIFLFGLGQNNYVIRLFARRMQNIGFDVFVPGPRDIVSRPNPGDITIFVSNSGGRHQMMKKVVVASELECPKVVITADSFSDLAQMADIIIPISKSSTATHTANIMGDDDEQAAQRHIKRSFEIASMFYLEGISVALMKILDVGEKQLRHVPKDWELKGKKALPSDGIIKDMIATGGVAEIGMEWGRLRAYKIKYLESYRPGYTDVSFYRGDELNIDDIVSAEETANIIAWMQKVRRIHGIQVKFRVALGQDAISWRGAAEHSNIAHAGERDKAIYTGEGLFRYMFRNGNEDLRKDILDNDELMHLRGLGHGSDKEVEKRLEAVNRVLIGFDMEGIHRKNVELIPPVDKGKTLWHVIPVELIPAEIASDFIAMNERINKDHPELKEKIKVVTERQELGAVLGKLLEEPGNLVDVAARGKKDLEILPQGVKALIFKIPDSGFVNVEGIIAALRALHREDIRALLMLYEDLTGSKFTGYPESELLKRLNDPEKLAAIIVFNLKPVELYDMEVLKELNEQLLKFIRSA